MIDFLKYKWLYFAISTLVIGVGIISIIIYGFKLSVDFVGGSTFILQTDKKIISKDVEQVFEKEKIHVYSITQTADKQYYIRSQAVDEVQETSIIKTIEEINKAKITVLKFETVGPSLGRETLVKTLIASIISILGILIYLTFAFSNFKYGFAAIVALFHDFLVVVGSYSLMSLFFRAEVDILFVTALLTTMSFSVHDTIVVFDKIREYRRRGEIASFTTMANRALTETMVRSLNNSLTIILMLVALLLIGGATIKFFVATLLVGTITGTYSSPFVAVPVLFFLESSRKQA